MTWKNMGRRGLGTEREREKDVLLLASVYKKKKIVCFWYVWVFYLAKCERADLRMDRKQPPASQPSSRPVFFLLSTYFRSIRNEVLFSDEKSTSIFCCLSSDVGLNDQNRLKFWPISKNIFSQQTIVTTAGNTKFAHVIVCRVPRTYNIIVWRYGQTDGLPKAQYYNCMRVCAVLG